MIVHDIMSTEFVAVSPDMTWGEAAALLLEKRLSSAPVVDDAGRLVGILSEKDLFRGLFPTHQDWTEAPHAYLDFQELEITSDASERRVADVMTTRLITAEPNTPVLKVGALMSSSGVHHVPVIQEGRPIGMVSRGTIYRAILEKYFGKKG